MGLFSSIGKALGSVAKVAAPVLGAVSGGSGWLGLAGTVGSGILSNMGTRQQQDFSSAQSTQQMAFQERMSSTAHQREVADLRAAGLNPILSAGGNGASSPSGSMAQAIDTISPALSTALQTRMMNAQIKQMETTNKNIEADTFKKQAEADLAGMQEFASAQSIKNSVIQQKLSELQIPEAAANAAVYESDVGKVVKAIDKISPGVGSAVGMAKGVGSAVKPVFNKLSPAFKLPLKGK